MQELIGKEVEVRSADTVYKGILIEIGETEIYLMSDNGWIGAAVVRSILWSEMLCCS